MPPPAAHKPLLDHYHRAWGAAELMHPPIGGRAAELPDEFVIAQYALVTSGTWGRRPRVFATVRVLPATGAAVEFFLPTLDASPRHAEILTCVAHYHLTGSSLGLHHTVNLGEPWVRKSLCTHAYLSLPYQFGPPLEWLRD